MKAIKERFKAITVFCTIIYEMIKNSGKLNDDKENNYNVCKDVCKRIISKAKIDCVVYGKNNIPDENCLIISNHISFFDIVIFLAQIDKSVGFAYAGNLLKLPVLRKYIKSIGGVAIHRDIKKIKKSVSDISSYLKKSSLIIFPEGECSYAVDKVKRFQRGCFISLRSMDVPIVPVYLKVDKLSKLGKWVAPLNKIKIIIGQSFKLHSKMTSKELAEYAYDIVVGLKDCY